MQMRDPNSMPLGAHHLASLLDRISKLEARITQLENTTPAYQQFSKGAAPVAGPASTARLYVVDNGAGKGSLRVVFPTGAAQTLATEP